MARGAPLPDHRRVFLPPSLPSLSRALLPVACLALLVAGPVEALATTTGAPPAEPESEMPWWFWPLALFVCCFILGVLAVPAGVGGGVLFVPIVGGFFPFHMDFVRGTGLMVALAGALAAGPGLLRSGMASLRLSMPLVLLASGASIVGAMAGLAMPADVVQVALGTTILGIVVLWWPATEAAASWAATRGTPQAWARCPRIMAPMMMIAPTASASTIITNDTCLRKAASAALIARTLSCPR